MAVGDENVRPAVEIVVEEKAAKAESEKGSAADFGLSGASSTKQSLAFVVIQAEHLMEKLVMSTLGAPEWS